MGPQFTPSTGIGTQYVQGGVVYQYTPNGWVAVASTTGQGNTGGQSTTSNPVQDLVNSLVEKQPVVSLPKLNYTPPSSSEISGKFKEFLDRAAKDPDIINYYTKLLNLAGGNYNIAIQYLDKDYQMGERQTQENLNAAMQQFGLEFPREQEQLAGNLNQRGIAMTDMGGGKVAYAGGGQPKTELMRLDENQRLRKEAEQRTANHAIDTLGLNREKGKVQAGQALEQTKLNAQKSQETDIFNRANSYMDTWGAQNAANYQKAQIDQKNAMLGGGSNQGEKPTSPGQNVNERINEWRWDGKSWV